MHLLRVSVVDNRHVGFNVHVVHVAYIDVHVHASMSTIKYLRNQIKKHLIVKTKKSK